MTIKLISSDPELNGSEIEILDSRDEPLLLVSLVECPRLAFYWLRDEMVWGDVNKCRCGQPGTLLSTSYGVWLCDRCRDKAAKAINNRFD